MAHPHTSLSHDDCPDCEGTGRLNIAELHHIPGLGTTQSTAPCDRCEGTGKA